MHLIPDIVDYAYIDYIKISSDNLPIENIDIVFSGSLCIYIYIYIYMLSAFPLKKILSRMYT